MRIVFQLGRTLDAGKQFQEARFNYEKAAAAGSTVAMNNIGSLYQ
jgi:hypothetical protein